MSCKLALLLIINMITPTIVLAFGKTPRDLNVLGEKEFKGKGVSHCAVCDGPFLKIKPLVL